MDLRKRHNHLKKELLNTFALKDALVLDMGCGAGGDFHKWREANVGHLVAADPSRYAIAEARKRIGFAPAATELIVGEIWNVTVLAFDFVFWNFSLQYTFDHEEHLDRVIQEMVRRSKPGTIIAGVVPDSHRIFMLPEQYEDPQGNRVLRGPLTGAIGESVSFFVAGAPYYRKGPVPEPVAWRDLLVTKMERAGFRLDMWHPFCLQYTGTVSDLYSTFAFSFRG